MWQRVAEMYTRIWPDPRAALDAICGNEYITVPQHLRTADAARSLRAVYEWIVAEYLPDVVMPDEAPDAGVKVEVRDPAVVMMAPVGDQHWGHYMWPAVYRLGDGRILVRIVYGEDVMPAYQDNRYLYYVSEDDGRHWMHVVVDDGELDRLLTDIGLRLPDGERVRFSPRMLEFETIPTRPRVRAFRTRHFQTDLYRLGDLPPELQSIPMFIRPADRTEWTEKEAFWDPDILLYAFRIERDGAERWRLFLPEPICICGEAWVSDGAILADGSIITSRENGRNMRHMRDLRADGTVESVPPASYIFRSRDRGRTWNCEATVPFQHLGPFETTRAHIEADLPGGNWAALIRTAGATFNTQCGPMLLTHSYDEGKTWSPPKAIRPCSVNPMGVALANGVAVRSYGRPGVYLTFSADGEGRLWGNDVTLVASRSVFPQEDSCCNGNFLVTGRDRFLYVYSEFLHLDPWGQRRKVIKAQEFVARPGG